MVFSAVIVAIFYLLPLELVIRSYFQL